MLLKAIVLGMLVGWLLPAAPLAAQAVGPPPGRQQQSQTGAASHDAAIGLARAGETGEALRILSRIAVEDPDNDAVFYDLLVVYSWNRQYQEAIRLYEAEQRADPPAYVLAAIAGAYYQTGQYGKARDIYRDLADQGNEQARIWQAEATLRLGDVRGAGQLYETIVNSQPGNYRGYLSRSLMHLEANDPVSAQADIAAALRLTAGLPAELQVRKEAAPALIRSGESSLGISLLRPAIDSGQADLHMQADYILALRLNANYREAIAEGHRLWPDLAAVPAYGLQALADSYLRAGKMAEANRIYRLSLHKQPNSNAVRLGLAYTCMISQDIEAGLEIYRGLLAAEPALAATVQDDAAALNKLGHFAAAKQLYTLLTDTFPDNLLFRREFAGDLLTNGFPRGAYEQYRQLSLLPAGELPGLAGMTAAAVRIGDYRRAGSHIAALQDRFAGSVYAMPAFRLYEVRRRGGLELSTASEANHKREETFRTQAAADWSAGGSYSLLASAGYERLSEDTDTGRETASLRHYALGARHVGLYHDYRIWYDAFDAAGYSSGFRLESRHFLDDDRLILGIDFSRSPVADVELLQNAADRIRSDQYHLSLSGKVGLKDNYSLALTTARYSDDNRFNNVSLYWNHAMLDRYNKNYNWFLFAARGKFKRQIAEYDSPETRLSYGAGLYGYWAVPAGYWAATATLEASADRPEPVDFTPYFRLEYGHRFSPFHELVAGMSYGLRTDRLNQRGGLHFNFRQYDLTYRLNW